MVLKFFSNLKDSTIFIYSSIQIVSQTWRHLWVPVKLSLCTHSLETVSGFFSPLGLPMNFAAFECSFSCQFIYIGPKADPFPWF